MQSNLSRLKELSEKLMSLRPHAIRLYLITRHIKPGISKSQKVLKKYDFEVAKIDLSDELQEYFRDVQTGQIKEALSDEEIEMSEYSVIDEDLHHRIYTYALNNALSFADVINDLLPNASRIKSVNSLKDVKDYLWAYCIKTEVDNIPVYSFRKISKGKIGTDQNDKGWRDKIRCQFNTDDAILEKLTKETINLDDKIDCIYFDFKFFVFKKNNFEFIVGLEDEFREHAEHILDDFKESNLIEGIEHIEKEIAQNHTLLKRLANLVRSHNYEKLTKIKIHKMEEIALKFGDTFKIKNSKVLIENTKDINMFVRLLNDYYKKGEITGRFYGSNSGKLLEPVK